MATEWRNKRGKSRWQPTLASGERIWCAVLWSELIGAAWGDRGTLMHRQPCTASARPSGWSGGSRSDATGKSSTRHTRRFVMTPAELRSLYEDAAIELRKLADVIEWAALDSHTLGASDGYAEALRDILRIARGEATRAEPKDPCGCYQCIEREISGKPFPDNLVQFMVLCETCGNKRCPHAEHHALRCTGSNEPGQPGAVRYPRVTREISPMTREEMFARMDEITNRFKPSGETNERESNA